MADSETKPPRHPSEGATRSNSVASDPTALTTQQLQRENFWLRELIETRIDGMDKAIKLLQAFADRTPTTMDVQHEVRALREVTMEKFESISKQFYQRDLAVEAALKAQERQAVLTNDFNTKVIEKMEATFTKLIEQNREIVQSGKDSTDMQIGDIKSRLDKGEGRTVATSEVRTDNRAITGTIIAGTVALFVILSSIVGLVTFVVTSRTPPPVVVPSSAVVR